MSNVDCSSNGILYPLTHPQKRIWYTEKIYPETSLHNIGGPIRIKGKIDFNILEESINIFIKNNDGLRLRFVEENGEVRQFVSYHKKLKIDFVDFSKYLNPEEEFNNWVREQAGKPFVIENERLFYFALFRISDYDNGYFVKFHHIISDGWSINIMTEHICDSYMKLLNGEEIQNTAAFSYIEYLENEKKYLSSDRYLKNKNFWNNKFKDFEDIFIKKSSDVIDGKRKTFTLGRELSSAIKQFAADNRVSLNTFFVTLYMIYLCKTTLQEDIIIGTPVLNRSGKKEKSMFGMFTSTMPFRFVIDDNLKAIDCMEKVNEQLMECYFNQKYPYDLLVKDLELNKKEFAGLFNTCVNYYNTRLNSELNGCTIENVEFYNGSQIYSLQIIVKDWCDSGSLVLDFDYKVNDYTDEEIEDTYARLLSLAKQIISNSAERVRNLSVLTNTEIKHLIYDFNATKAKYPREKTIYQLFEEQAARTPEKVAVRFDSCVLTYKQLNEKANQLARYLNQKGIQKEDIVGLLTTHSIETVIGILGVLKAGGAYLPIDPGYPEDRICYMLENSNAGILLTNVELSESISFKGKIIKLNNQKIYCGEASNLECVNNPSDLAYIIYTSGSTGKPKGAMIKHGGLTNYIWWAKKMYVKNHDEVFPLYSSLAFDLTVTSIFTPLICGCEIIVYEEKSEDIYVLYRILKENKSTVIKLTPAQLSLIKDMDNKNSSVKRFIVGGEDLKVSLAKDIYTSFNGSIEIFNEYGPTETVVGCMIHKYDYEKDDRISVPIGIPADNVQIYILDKNLNPVSTNTVGEMYISGDGVARGYLNRPELTKDRFIANPFISNQKMYKTGDLARFLSNGKIEYIGRADHQVKIRGYRVELGEIEKYILSHKAVKDAIVIDLTNTNNDKYLCAYIVSDANITSDELKLYLKKHIPDYMIPVFFIELEKIPLTINGKVDIKSLPQPEFETIKSEGFVTYRNDKEKYLALAICEVLNLEAVSLRQNFIYLGGDSIKAIQVASKLNTNGLTIKVKDILSHPVIEEMVTYIEENKETTDTDSTCEGVIQLTPIVTWFLEQNFYNPNYYNQSVLLDIKKGIDISRLEVIFNELIRHHDSFRINYNPISGEMYYNIELLKEFYHIKEYDLAGLSATEQVNKMTLIAEALKSSFNIENGILIKACVFSLGEDVKRMLIAAHHLGVDGVSWRIILEDIDKMAKQISNGQRITLSSKTNSYQQWAKALTAYSYNENEKNYWKQMLTKKFAFPEEFNMGEETVESSTCIELQLNQYLTQRLLTKANMAYNTEPKDLMILSLLRTIKEFTGIQDIIIELEGHGREDIFKGVDISRTTGWFTSLYPFYTHMLEDNLSNQIKKIKEEIRMIPNKGIGFGILKYISKDLNDSYKSSVRFNFLGDFNSGDGNNHFDLLKEQLGNDFDKDNKLSSGIEMNCFVVDGKLNVLLTYSKNKFSENTMGRFLNNYMGDLETTINYCCEKESVSFTPSDFDTADISQDELDKLFS